MGSGTAVTRGYAHGVPKRLRDEVDSLEEGKRIILEGWKQEESVGRVERIWNAPPWQKSAKKGKNFVRKLLGIWRRGWDSNPRWPLDHSVFRVRTRPSA